MTKRQRMKQIAAQAVKRNYWQMVVVCLIPEVFSIAVLATDGIIATILAAVAAAFVGAPLLIGVTRYILANRNEKAEFSDLLVGFGDYLNVVTVMVAVTLIEAAFGLLLIVPGVLKAYQYRMVPFLLAQDPGKSLKACLKESTEMMTGEKYKAFCFDVSFLGWFLLAAVTGQVAGIFWVWPYYRQSCAEYYFALRERRREIKDFDDMDDYEL